MAAAERTGKRRVFGRNVCDSEITGGRTRGAGQAASGASEAGAPAFHPPFHGAGSGLLLLSPLSPRKCRILPSYFLVSSPFQKALVRDAAAVANGRTRQRGRLDRIIRPEALCSLEHASISDVKGASRGVRRPRTPPRLADPPRPQSPGQHSVNNDRRRLRGAPCPVIHARASPRHGCRRQIGSPQRALGGRGGSPLEDGGAGWHGGACLLRTPRCTVLRAGRPRGRPRFGQLEGLRTCSVRVGIYSVLTDPRRPKPMSCGGHHCTCRSLLSCHLTSAEWAKVTKPFSTGKKWAMSL